MFLSFRRMPLSGGGLFLVVLILLAGCTAQGLQKASQALEKTADALDQAAEPVAGPDSAGKMIRVPATPNPPPTPVEPVETKPLETPAVEPPRFEDQGDFKLGYAESSDPTANEWMVYLKESRHFEGIVDGLNAFVALPRDVPVVFQDCGEANAFYLPEETTLVLCYELVSELQALFAENTAEEEDPTKSTLFATEFIFYHEAGHALIHLLDLPATGREEDSVDQLATFLLIERGDEAGPGIALNAAAAFMLWSSLEEPGELAFWDEHALGQQRFYNIACWVYGRNPEGFANLIDDEVLPAERAESCPDEYYKLSMAWARLLEPYLKEGT